MSLRGLMAAPARWLGARCFQLGRLIDPPVYAPLPVVAAPVTEVQDEMSQVQKLLGTMQLRAALRRYSPIEVEAQA